MHEARLSVRLEPGRSRSLASGPISMVVATARDAAGRRLRGACLNFRLSGEGTLAFGTDAHNARVVADQLGEAWVDYAPPPGAAPAGSLEAEIRVSSEEPAVAAIEVEQSDDRFRYLLGAAKDNAPQSG